MMKDGRKAGISKMDYEKNRQAILNRLLAELETFPDGEITTTARLCEKCFPEDFGDTNRAGDISSLFEIHLDLLQEAEKHGLLLDMSSHENKCEGLPFNLEYPVYRSAGKC